MFIYGDETCKIIINNNLEEYMFENNCIIGGF